MTGVTRMQHPPSPGQSAAPGPAAGQHVPSRLCSASLPHRRWGRGRQEHAPHISPISISPNHSLFPARTAPQHCALPCSAFSSAKARFTEIPLTAAAQRGLVHPHWSPKRYCGCFSPFAERLFRRTASHSSQRVQSSPVCASAGSSARFSEMRSIRLPSRASRRILTICTVYSRHFISYV